MEVAQEIYNAVHDACVKRGLLDASDPNTGTVHGIYFLAFTEIGNHQIVLGRVSSKNVLANAERFEVESSIMQIASNPFLREKVAELFGLPIPPAIESPVQAQEPSTDPKPETESKPAVGQ